MRKGVQFTIILFFCFETLFAQSDSLKIDKFYFTAELYGGINLTGYSEQLSTNYMVSLGGGYQIGKRWSLLSNIGFGKMTYVNKFDDGNVVFLADIESNNLRIPVLSSYDFLKNRTQKTFSIAIGIGYSEQRSTKTSFSIKQVSNGGLNKYSIICSVWEVNVWCFKANKIF